MAHVAILGGGFGGLAAAHELRTLHPDIDVTLVSRDDHFYMGFAKLWDLGRMRPLHEGTRSLESLTSRGVRFLHTDILSIDADERRVVTDAETFEADAILIALGASVAPRHRTLLEAPGAHDLYDGDQLTAIHRALDDLDEGRVLISILGGPFKCPPAPYEAALLVDVRLRARGVREHVELAVSTPQPITLPVAGPDASAYVAGHLGERDIEVLEKKKVAAIDEAVPAVRFDDGSTLDYTVLLGVPATAPPPVLTDSGLCGESGWIEPDRATLRTSAEGIYAVGDCTHIPTATAALPKAGVFAAGEAIVAAHNIAADLGYGEHDNFDGHGYCFLELPGEQVAFVEGNFYAEPKPDVTLSEADHDQFLRKQAYERENLDAWLG